MLRIPDALFLLLLLLLSFTICGRDLLLGLLSSLATTEEIGQDEPRALVETVSWDQVQDPTGPVGAKGCHELGEQDNHEEIQ